MKDGNENGDLMMKKKKCRRVLRNSFENRFEELVWVKLVTRERRMSQPIICNKALSESCKKYLPT